MATGSGAPPLPVVSSGRQETGLACRGDSTYADVFLFRPRTSGEAVIDLWSADFDAYLILQDVAGHPS